MMNNYTITLSDAENKALAFVALDPQEWIDNVVKERCRIAIEEIVGIETARMIADPSITSIPANQDEIVMSANIQSAYEKHMAEISKQNT
jgi:hypothetical protein